MVITYSYVKALGCDMNMDISYWLWTWSPNLVNIKII